MIFNRITQQYKAVTVILGLVLSWSVMNPEICAAEPRKSALEQQELEDVHEAASVAVQREAALPPTRWEVKHETNTEEVYVVYSGKDSQEKQRFLDAFPPEFTVKSYNVDRLRAGDYPEKQKALTMFQNAIVIVFLSDEPMQLFKGSTLSRDLVIVESIMTGVTSIGRTLYVLSQDMDSDHLEKQLKILHRTAGLVRIKENTLPVAEMASLLTARILKPQ